ITSSAMPSDSGADNAPPSAIDSPANDQTELLSQILATINANAAMMRSFDSKFDKIEKEIAHLKSAGSAPTRGTAVGMVPASTAASGTATAGSIPPAEGLDTPKPNPPLATAARPEPQAAHFTTPKVAWATAPHQESHSPAQILRPGPVPATAARPGQTPATPRARGVSGFYVPVTPKKPSTSSTTTKIAV
ncbi:hypothetical protein OC844_008044, partial [Tilletia horrida]